MQVSLDYNDTSWKYHNLRIEEKAWLTWTDFAFYACSFCSVDQFAGLWLFMVMLSFHLLLQEFPGNKIQFLRQLLLCSKVPFPLSIFCRGCNHLEICFCTCLALHTHLVLLGLYSSVYNMLINSWFFLENSYSIKYLITARVPAWSGDL